MIVNGMIVPVTAADLQARYGSNSSYIKLDSKLVSTLRDEHPDWRLELKDSAEDPEPIVLSKDGRAFFDSNGAMYLVV